MVASAAAPSTSKWVDIVAALVPAEVLALHAVAISLWTKTTEPAAGSDEGAVTTITNNGALGGAFYVLIGMALLLYLLNKKGKWSALDFGRMLLPPIAFVAWTMVQQNTAFDAAFHVGDDVRLWYGAVLATVVGAAAKKLADGADDENVSGGVEIAPAAADATAPPPKP